MTEPTPPDLETSQALVKLPPLKIDRELIENVANSLSQVAKDGQKSSIEKLFKNQPLRKPQAPTQEQLNELKELLLDFIDQRDQEIDLDAHQFFDEEITVAKIQARGSYLFSRHFNNRISPILEEIKFSSIAIGNEALYGAVEILIDKQWGLEESLVMPDGSPLRDELVPFAITDRCISLAKDALALTAALRHSIAGQAAATGNHTETRDDKKDGKTKPKKKRGPKFKYFDSEENWNRREEYFQDWINFRNTINGTIKQFLEWRPEIATACDKDEISLSKLKDTMRKYPSPEDCKEFFQEWNGDINKKTSEEFCKHKAYDRDGKRIKLTVEKFEQVKQLGKMFGW